MPYTLLTVDGQRLIDANVEPSASAPPPDLAALLRVADPKPWMRPTLMVITDAILSSRPVTITITTDGDDFTMGVATP